MRIKITIIFLSICFQTSFSQPVFENDPEYKSLKGINRKVYSRIKSKYKLAKRPDFVYRVWIRQSLSYDGVLFVISQKNNRWSIRCFEFGWELIENSSSKSRAYDREKIAVDNDITKLIGKLQENHYLTIPDSELLKDSTGKIIDDLSSDGIHYRFELISRKNKRSYFYHCPQFQASQYPYIKNLQQVTDIIKILCKYYDIDKDFICYRKKKKYNC